ncbi:S1C family serine protease [Piscinibacter terrae]|uniref:Serine protease n=1 Tax=Piscinibacter terrae TaxID=2496871 RepID=A0A3N7HJY6_9BURK|nr:S1C family serine protease [Albitalea terrae]RQP22384.1 serine protease [Albitalea terrae]
MTSLRWTTLWGAALAGLAAPLVHAAALQPAQVYDKVSPSVWRVQTYDVDGLPIGIGSGVVIAPDTLVTNCHVLAKAKRVAVKHDKISIDAKLDLWDPPRDVCQIKAPNLNAPAVKLGDASALSVGQNVFAIGNPKGLDLTMSAGLLSSIRRNDKDQIILLQTSAAISGGSSGGGLFDDQGVLIGLTTIGSITGDAQNLNFAVPVDWVKELPQRHAKAAAAAAAKAASAAASAPTAVAAAAPPAVPPNVVAAAVTAPAKGGIEDVSRLPYASEQMRDRYRVFLTRPLPRAFVISEGGKWYQAWGTKVKDPAAPTDPGARALAECEKLGAGKCFLYAVDDKVVYDKAEGQ